MHNCIVSCRTLLQVVVVKESEWKTTPLDKKEELLSQCFSLAGLKVDKLRKKRKETEELDDQTSEDILTRIAIRIPSLCVAECGCRCDGVVRHARHCPE